MTNIPQNTRKWVHQLRDGYTPGLRVDKTETVFYQTMERLGNNRKMKGSFYLSDLVTDFRITVNGIDNSGRVGYAYSSVQTQLPFYILYELPVSMTIDDVLYVPVTVKNLADETVSYSLTLTASPELEVSFDESELSNVRSGKSDTVYVMVTAKALTDSAFLFVQAEAVGSNSGSTYADSYISRTSVNPWGFPVDKSQSGMIGSQVSSTDTPSSFQYSIELPDTMVDNTFQFEVKIMPSTFSSLLEAVEALIGTPSGCFEQTSATAFPMIMALEFVQSLPEQSEETNDIQARILAKLRPAYDKLVSFKTPCEEGFEWFGDCPAHQPLTAYGLLEFTRLSKVVDFVDPSLITNTQDYLLSQRNSQGGFDISEYSLDTFGGAPYIYNAAYIIWVMYNTDVETDELKDQLQELDDYLSEAGTDTDPYLLALACDSHYIAGNTEQAQFYATRLTSFQQPEGNVTGASTSVTSSRGVNLVLETTAVSVMCWLNDNSRYSENSKLGIDYIASQSIRGSYGST